MIRIGDLIDNRYRIVSLLGEGGMGTVYEAVDIITKRNVALKFLKANVARDKVNLPVLKLVSNCDFKSFKYCSCISVGKYENLPYMVNELIVGNNFEDELQTRGRYTF